MLTGATVDVNAEFQYKLWFICCGPKILILIYINNNTNVCMYVSVSIQTINWKQKLQMLFPVVPLVT